MTFSPIQFDVLASFNAVPPWRECARYAQKASVSASVRPGSAVHNLARENALVANAVSV